MKVSRVLLIALCIMALVLVIKADVVFTYIGLINVYVIKSPITVVPGQCPCGCSSWSQTPSGFTTTITAYALSTTSGYVLTTPLVQFNTTTGGTLTMTLTPSKYLANDYVNGTIIYPTPGSFSLGVGNYLLIQKLTLNTAVSSTSITLSGQYNYTPTPGVTFQYSFSETINPPSANVMNLLNGLQAFYVPHVYQGDSSGHSTSQWPVYYGPSTASSYWSPISTSINQPVLDMTPLQGTTAGAMFWSEYYSGGSITITLIGTFSKYSSVPAHGYEIYLFLNPTMWSISLAYNWSIPYEAVFSSSYPSPVHGDVILPQSSTPYIVVQWDPYWQISYTTSGATGQWNVWIVSNPSGNNAIINPSPSPNGVGSAGWNGIGTGYFKPNPGDYICVTVTYNPSTNTLAGIAYDMNTGQSANFTLNLNGYYTPPTSGNYVFGIGASTGKSYANWGVVYVNYQG